MMASVPLPFEPADRAPASVPRSTVDLESAYRDQYASLVRLASILVDDVGTCEEVVQEAFVRVWQRGGALREADRLPAYLRSAVLNGARSHLRKVVVRRRHLSSVPPPGAGSRDDTGAGAGAGTGAGAGAAAGRGAGAAGRGAGTDVEAVGTDTGEGPEAGAVASDETRQVLAALRTLPDRQREVLALRYYMDLSEAEIAVTLGISPGSVKTHAHRGLATLTDRLETLR
jgi:RNA polymerase sigma factor (sigma-70 family)